VGYAGQHQQRPSAFLNRALSETPRPQ
jgi:hypothetical protein